MGSNGSAMTLRRKFLCHAWLFTAQLLAAQTATHCSVVGHLEVRPFKSTVFHNSRMLRVWLPPGYDDPTQPSKRYPVLYLNDGQNIFDACTSLFSTREWRADETAKSLIEDGKIQPLIIVGIDNAGKKDRPKEYLPFPDESLQPTVPHVRGKEYPRFLLEEVIPFIDRHYRTDRAPSKTGIGGSSYGAGIALFTVMEYPGRFGRLLLESPSLYAHDDYLLHRAKNFHRWPEKVFLGVGTVNEPVEDVQRLRNILERDSLQNHKAIATRLLTRQQEGAAHNEEAWSNRLPEALMFLYGH